MGREIKYCHPEMAAIMQKVRERMADYPAFHSANPEQQTALFCRFARALADRHPRDLTWEEICEAGWREKSAAGVALVFALTLLDEDVFEARIADALRAWRPHVEHALAQEGSKRLTLPLYLCDSCVEWLAADPATAEFTVAMFGMGLRNSFAEMGKVALDPDMVPLLRETIGACYSGTVLGDLPKATMVYAKAFFAAYASRSPQDISWEEECATRNQGKGLQHQVLRLFTILLDRGLYARDHRETLEGLNAGFKALLEKTICFSSDIMCGKDIDYLCILPANISNETGCHRPYLVVLKTDNPFLRNLLAGFLQAEQTGFLHPSTERVEVLLRSIGDAAEGISRLEDFTASLFWRQAQFLRDEFADDALWLKRHARFLRGFYQYLAALDPERDLFEDATSLSTELLHSSALTDYITSGYLVTSFSPGIDLGAAERVVLILRGYDNLSTRVMSEDSVKLDISSLRCPLYRQEVLAFACRSPQTIVASKRQIPHICQALQALFEAKGRKGYPNPRLERVSRAEAVLIRKTVDRMDIATPSKAQILSSVGVFLRWERDARKRISVEEYALDSLYGFSQGTSRNDARAASKEDLAKLSALLAEKSRDSLEWKLSNAVFHLLLQTEFRIGQICHLSIDCVRPTAKPNEHVISSTSKTSKGEKEECIITQRTLDVLNGAIDATEDIRRMFAKRSVSRYIFIYLDERGRLRRMSTKRFSEKLAECCVELEITPPYTASNLRDTHATLAVRFSTNEDGEINPSAAVLSGHAGIATTVEHYLDVDIDEMIAATFDVYIGDNLQVDADGRVVEVIPEEARGADRVVEGGCGCCTAQCCSVTSPMPCLVCESFVTTVEHEPFFVRAMEAVDAQLQHAASRHDAEDLTTIKRLLAAYLTAIYRKKREREQKAHE